jgi:hypothetical protein
VNWAGLGRGKLITDLVPLHTSCSIFCIERPVQTDVWTGRNWSQPVSDETGPDRLVNRNRTEINRLQVVWSGYLDMRVQLQPVAVAVAPIFV